jgi:hypothetical protein
MTIHGTIPATITSIFTITFATNESIPEERESIFLCFGCQSATAYQHPSVRPLTVVTSL